MKTTEKNHYWQGEWIDDSKLVAKIVKLPTIISQTLQTPLETETVLGAAELLAAKLTAGPKSNQIRARLKKCLLEAGDVASGTEAEIDEGLAEIAVLLQRPNLEKKLERELGSKNPFRVSRRLYDDNVFESWAPLGLIVHISPQNSFATGAMSVLEGLLSGNINFLKTGGSESLFSQHFLAALVECDPTENLRNSIIVAKISSKNTELLSQVFKVSDGVAAWGGEESAQAIKQMTPPHVRIIEWGHRISFAYLTRDFFSDSKKLESVAKECCTLEQQACSSPQCFYLETESWDELNEVAVRFSKILEKVSARTPRIEPEGAEAAEITQVRECHRMEACLSHAAVIESKRDEWRILVDHREALTASPLYRTIWIKPLPRTKILSVLRPMRQYLQTVGLGCKTGDLPELTRAFFSAGATRVRNLGEMLGGYPGEPHDGVYSLQRYCRRVSVQTGADTRGISNFDEIKNLPGPAWTESRAQIKAPRVTTKEDFTAEQTQADLYFKSGGSSGEAKLSSFTYDQYDDQMWMGAEGLYAAGLDPLTDRAINLFFCGGLYGGFISIFSSLERLRVKQFPMAAHSDLEMVGQTIVKNKINVLLGMPSYIMGLFNANAALFAKYHGVKKIFYGGEHFSESQKTHLIQHYGVEIIKSGAYGSVDIGPMGYQCSFCNEGDHHLQQRLHSLEILKLDEDTPVKGNEVGRLVFTPRETHSNKPIRYAIGDVGHWITDHGGVCRCGRSSPRFKLLGRVGDIFRIGTMFLNYQKFQKILSDAGYSGDFQIKLMEDDLLKGDLREKVLLVMGSPQLNEKKARELCLNEYADLNEAVNKDKLLLFEVELGSSLEKSRASGKLLRVVDKRFTKRNTNNTKNRTSGRKP